MTRFFPVPPEQAGQVLEFYETMIDDMSQWPEKPGWRKGIYPTGDYLEQAAGQGELFALTVDGELAGAVVLNRRWAEAYDSVPWPVAAGRDEVMVIHTLGISPRFHRRGLGRLMMDRCAQTARDGGCRALRLDVLSTNRPAQKFYPAAGFVLADTVKIWYPDTGLADFLMFERAL